MQHPPEWVPGPQKSGGVFAGIGTHCSAECNGCPGFFGPRTPQMTVDHSPQQNGDYPDGLLDTVNLPNIARGERADRSVSRYVTAKMYGRRRPDCRAGTGATCWLGEAGTRVQMFPCRLRPSGEARN